MAPGYLHEKSLTGKPDLYFGDTDWINLCLGDFGVLGQNCLAAKTRPIGADTMNASGWIFLILSWSGILGFTAFCFLKVFSKKQLK